MARRNSVIAVLLMTTVILLGVPTPAFAQSITVVQPPSGSISGVTTAQPNQTITGVTSSQSNQTISGVTSAQPNQTISGVTSAQPNQTISGVIGAPDYSGQNLQTESNSCSFLSNLFSFNFLNIIICFLNSVVAAIMALLLLLADQFVNFAISINSSANFSSGVAQQGWALSLGFTNYLFVIGLIAIAFGTMLRRSFGKEILPKFIIVALLIGFSFTIALLFITASNNVTQSFMAITTQSSDVWGSLANKFNFSTNIPLVPGLDLSTTLTNLANLAFIVIFGLIAIVTLLAVGVMFLYRYIALVLLLILLPFACFLGIFPLKVAGEGNFWEKWTSEFTRWIIFGPAMGFFIYLSFSILSAPAMTVNSASGFFGNIGNMVALIGLLIGGLYVANKLGIAGASYALGLAKDRIPAMVGGGIVAGGTWARDKWAASGSKEGGPNNATRTAQTLAKYSAVPGFKKLSLATAKLGKAEGEKFEGEMKKLAPADKESLVGFINNSSTNRLSSSPAEIAALMNKGAKEGTFEEGTIEKLNPEKLQKMLEITRSTGKFEDILTARPDWAEKFGKNITQTTRSVDPLKINLAAIKNPEKGPDVVAAFEKEDLDKIGRSGKPAIKQEIKNISANFVNTKAAYQSAPDYQGSDAQKKTEELANKVFAEFKKKNSQFAGEAKDMSALQISAELKDQIKDKESLIAKANKAQNITESADRTTEKEALQSQLNIINGQLNSKELGMTNVSNYTKDNINFADRVIKKAASDAK